MDGDTRRYICFNESKESTRSLCSNAQELHTQNQLVENITLDTDRATERVNAAARTAGSLAAGVRSHNRVSGYYLLLLLILLFPSRSLSYPWFTIEGRAI